MSDEIVSLDTSLAMLQEKELPDLSAIELHWQRMKNILDPQEVKQRKQRSTGIYTATSIVLLLGALIYVFRPEGKRPVKHEPDGASIEQSAKIPPVQSILPLVKKDSMPQANVPKRRQTINRMDTIPAAKQNTKPSVDRMIVYPGANRNKAAPAKNSTAKVDPIDAQSGQKSTKNRFGFRKRPAKNGLKKVQTDSPITIS